MRYRDFWEEAYRAIRAQAPPLWQLHDGAAWLRSIGELLLHMPPELQQEWADQYATLLVITYGHICAEVAVVCVRHGLTEAQAQWPARVAVVR